MIRAAVVVFLTAAGLQTQTSPPAAQASSPAACMQAVRDYVSTRQKAAGQLTDQVLRELEQTRAAMTKDCAARFDPASVPEEQLPELVDVATETANWDLGTRALDRALASRALSAPARAKLLAVGVRFGARPPRSEARLARAETCMQELDAMPDALEPRIAAHVSLNSFYRWDDVDAGIMKHSGWLIDHAPALTPELRGRFARSFVTAYMNMAQVLAGRGEHERAIDLLQRAPKEIPEAADAVKRIQPEIDRFTLVGKPGAPITAPRWLNIAPDTKSLDLKGAVTLLEFTAHWCTPCKESYPGIKRLIAQYNPRGLRVVLATELFGYFGSDRGLAPDVEFERDKEYFSKEGLHVPIAVADRATSAARNPNDAAYKVGGIPHIYLLDRQGAIRLIMVGYDEANEQKLSAMVERLLGETAPTQR